MIYGFACVIEQVDDAAEIPWRAIIIWGASNAADPPVIEHGYGATEKAAVLAAIDKMTFKDEYGSEL